MDIPLVYFKACHRIWFIQVELGKFNLELRIEPKELRSGTETFSSCLVPLSQELNLLGLIRFGALFSFL